MKNFVKEVDIRWSDLDPNAHLRHSIYYDWGAFSRIEFLYAHGLTTEMMQQLQVGPILFREECIFRREIRLGDKITIDLKLIKTRKDYSRWTIQHTIIKNGDIVSAILTVDGAWLDTSKRKLAIPPQQVAGAFSQMPLADNFQWDD
jgi:acyl-CoA thioester hydrolase